MTKAQGRERKTSPLPERTLSKLRKSNFVEKREDSQSDKMEVDSFSENEDNNRSSAV